jgi:hypothetical protein
MFQVSFQTSERSVAQQFRLYINGPSINSISNTCIVVTGYLTSQSHADTFLIVLAPYILKGLVRSLTIVPVKE